MEETEELDLPIGPPEPRPDVRLLRSITPRNILSFGPKTPTLELRALNVLIGPNGSGKSNLLTVVDLLKNTASSLDLGILLGEEVIWKGAEDNPAYVEAIVHPPFAELVFEHQLWLQPIGPVVFRVAERIMEEQQGEIPPLFDYYDSTKRGEATIMTNGHRETISDKRLNRDASILVQYRDPSQNSEITELAEAYQRIRLFRDWGFGNFNIPRRPQRTDGRADFLLADGSNLAMVLSRLRRVPASKKKFLAALNELYEGVTDFDVGLEGGYAQAYLHEGEFSIPASRLSDGTLKYIQLLAILLHPTPPPLICLEEPELGLHPDAVLAIGKLIKEASERTQIIVTTHSDILVDVLGAQPEDIIVCEKHDGTTSMKRLNEPELRGWLERYSISELWTRGHLGGNRW